jgi:type 1 glutamine amidotransferase
MRRVFLISGGVLAVSLLTAASLARADDGSRPASQPKAIRGLMFVGGGSHDYDSLPKRLADRLRQDGIDIRVTSDLGDLTEDNVAAADVLVFNACLDKGMDQPKQKILVNALRQGKGLVAMHCALWCFQDWPEWRKILGGLVLTHDKFGSYEVGVVYSQHPIARGVPVAFTNTDEAYYVDQRGSDICVIAQTAKTHPGRPSPDPQVWTNRYAGGRIFVNSMGHDEQALFNPAYLQFLVNGIRWAAGRLGPPTLLSELERQEGFLPLFDGNTLRGWRYDAKLWKAQDGVIVGKVEGEPLQVNSCAIAKGEYGDFTLRFSVKLISGNSGVQFRSQELPHFEVAGYQADIVPLGWGNLHEQNGRRRLVDGWSKKGEYAVNPADWNDMSVEARGRRIIIKANGMITADYTEADESKPLTGIIGLQLHRDTFMETRFTNIRIKPLDPSQGPKR